MWKKHAKTIALALLGSVVIAAFWTVFSKAQMVWAHVDDGTPVSEQKKSFVKLENLAEGTEKKSAKALTSVECAVKELDKQRRDLAAQPDKGSISRDTSIRRGVGNVIFVNSNSDARKFKRNESVLVIANGISITAVVQGTIINTDDMVIGQLNEDAANEIDLSRKRGVLQNATIKRDIPGTDGSEPTADCLARAGEGAV